MIEGHEAPPIVNNGVMFIATPMGQVIALNAKTGDEYWRYKRQLPDDLFQLHPTSRGVGLWQDKLYLATTDDHVVALDAKTGKVVWDTKVQDYKKGQYLTLMPLVDRRQGHRRRLRRRIRRPRLCRRLRCQQRQGAVADLHDSRRRASPAARPGAATTGKPAADRPG